jgi:signal transduction histidine kinase
MSTLEIDKLVTELAESKRKLEIFRKVSAELNKLISLPEKLHNILAILDRQFGLSNSLILIPDEQVQALVVYASHGYNTPMIGKEVPYGQGIIGLSAIRKKHINLTGIQRKQHYLATVSSEGDIDLIKPIGLSDAESQVSIPLLSNNDLVAVLMAESRNFCVFDKADENFLITLAQPLAVSIQNSILYDSMEKKIQERTAELRRVNNTKDKFFSIISHDLRGPVTSFQSLTRLFSHYNKLGQSDKIERLCLKVDQSVDTLNHLLENLLDWSLSQTNGIQCFVQKIVLKDFLKNIVDLYQSTISSKEIDFYLEVSDNIQINGDQHTLATVLRNLLSNSIKFTPRKGSIHISAFAQGDRVMVSIKDTGVGIDCKKLINLFQLQGERSTCGTEKEKGTGLGLVLVKEFVKLNNGHLTIESAPDTGTHIKLELPRA